MNLYTLSGHGYEEHHSLDLIHDQVFSQATFEVMVFQVLPEAFNRGLEVASTTHPDLLLSNPPKVWARWWDLLDWIGRILCERYGFQPAVRTAQVSGWGDAGLYCLGYDSGQNELDERLAEAIKTAYRGRFGAEPPPDEVYDDWRSPVLDVSGRQAWEKDQ
jgi:hypothetical protein